MRDALDSLSSRRIVLIGGKGGVGKTTISSFAALHFARSRPVILFTTDPASNLADLFTEPPANVTIESVDAASLYARFLQENLPSFLEIADRGTYLDRGELQRFFELSLPGVDELMSWMRIGELAESHPESIVVVDTAPTGHALRMIGAAEHFRQLANALDAMDEKHRGMIRQFMRRDVRDEMDEFIETFESTAARRRAMLRDPHASAFVPVFLSEPWVIEQTLRLVAEVREEGIDVPFAVLNRAIVDVDCSLCESRRARDASAKARIEPLPVVDFARSCAPLEQHNAFSPTRRRAGEVSRRPDEGDFPSRAAEAGGATLRMPPGAKLIFFAGKGGVGKTTCAASLALQIAAQQPEKKFTIISVDPAHALRDVFAHEKPPHNLAVETIDTRAKWRRFREKLGDEIERAIGALTPSGMSIAYESDALRQLLEVAPPGADELFAIDRLAELLADETQSCVIVDTAPTGHFLRLMDLPTTAGEWVREFMRILLRYRDLVPAGSLGAELVSASRALNSLSGALRSDASAVFVVTRPERVVVAETKRLIEELHARGIPTAGVVANYVTPESGCPCDQMMRAHELAALGDLPGNRVVIPRRDRPVTSLAELAALFEVASDSTAG